VEEILNNPFRYLGIFANSTLKEQTAQATLRKAYARVDQQIDNPLLLQHLMGPLPDDEETIVENESLLDLASEREFHAAFWFMHGPNPDEDLEAVALLDKGKSSKALDIWKQRDDPEALQNIIVASLILNDWAKATESAQKLYHHESEIRRFVLAVTSGFDISIKQMSDAVTDNPLWSAVLKDMQIETYRKHISEAIEKNDSSLLDAAEDLIRLREIVGEHDVLYKVLTEQLAKALAEQYKYSDDMVHVVKCLNKAYDLDIDEQTKAKIVKRLTTIINTHGQGIPGMRTDIPEVREASKQKMAIGCGIIGLFLFVLIFLTRTCSTYDTPTLPNFKPIEIPDVKPLKYQKIEIPEYNSTVPSVPDLDNPKHTAPLLPPTESHEITDEKQGEETGNVSKQTENPKDEENMPDMPKQEEESLPE